jgi:hypothetical protein
MRLAVGGKAQVTVVASPGAGELVRAATTDLVRCLGKAIGADVPLVATPSDATTPLTIVVGEHEGTDITGLARDGCIIKTVGNHLTITGATDSGISNGVYTFLIEQIGARWFVPDPLYEVIPSHPNLTLPILNYRRDPDFRYRMMPGGPPVVGKEWERRNRLDPDESGISRYNFGHNMASIIPASKYGKEHPEYFAMIDGRRKVPPVDSGTNPCFTNPDVIRIGAEAAHAFFLRNPAIDTFSVSINDVADHCQCPNCAALDAGLPLGQGGVVAFSESYFHLVNEVAKIVAKTDPGKYIGCFPYWPVYPLPRRIDKLPDNVALILTQDTSQQHNPLYRDAERAHWVAWRMKCSSMARYDYYELGWMTPRYYPHIAASDLKFIHANGCDGFLGAMSPVWCELGPHIYVASRLLWDTSLDADTLLNDYFKSLFGPAAPDIKRYYATLEKYWLKPRPARWFEGLAGITSEYTIIDGALIDEAWRSLEQAERAATGIELQRVKDVKDHFRFSYLLVKAQADARDLAKRRVKSRAGMDALADGILRASAMMPEAKQAYATWWEPSKLYNASYNSAGGMPDRLRDWSYEQRKWLTIAAGNARRFALTLPLADRTAAWDGFRQKLLSRDAELGTANLVRDYRDEFDRSDKAIRNGAGYSEHSNKTGGLAWAESYLLMGYVEMYRATHDRAYLRRLVTHFDSVLKNRDDVLGLVDVYAGKPLAGWGSDHYSDGKWHVWIVHTGMITIGPAQFVRLVSEDKALADEFGTKAAEYRARIEECIRDSEQYWHDGPEADEGYYYGAHLKNVLPLNQQNALGIVLLDIYHATGNAAYLDKVKRLARFFHRRLRYPHSDYLDWAYWPKLNDDGEGSEDISHAGINVQFAAQCALDGGVFPVPDAIRIARTWLQVVRRSDGTWADTVGGEGKGNTYMPYSVGNWLVLCPLLPDHMATKLYQEAVRAFVPKDLYGPSEMLGLAHLLRLAPTAPNGAN